jgi:rhodanese-related sulfurtransferase
MKSSVRFALIIVFLVAAVPILTGLVSATGSQANAQQSGDGVRRISPAELREVLKKGQAILIDVRSEESYRAGHIKGARLIPVNDIGSKIGELPKDKLIATYCSWPNEHTSARAVQTLNENGIKNAAAVLGGYDALIKAGFPAEEGKNEGKGS